MGQVDPQFNFGFNAIDKGTYVLEVAETGIDAQKSGKDSGKCYWARLAVVGGDQEGKTHIERFYEKSKEDFSFAKLAGFLYKMGIIKTLGKVDTAFFLALEFENRWKTSLIGKRMGVKIDHRFMDTDKDREKPQSNLIAYYTVGEAAAILTKRVGGAPTTAATAPAVNVPAGMGCTTSPVQKAPWD